MNPHFQQSIGSEDQANDRRTVLPARGYGRVDHIVFPEDPFNKALIAIDLVDADWFDQQTTLDALFSTDDTARSEAWRAYKAQLCGSVRPLNPFENAPLFRLEIEMDITWFNMLKIPAPYAPVSDKEIARIEKLWLDIDIRPAHYGAVDTAQLYRGLFAEPIPVYVQGTLPSRKLAKLLSNVFSLSHLPTVTNQDIELVLRQAQAEMLSVYDVGQGNANALTNLCYIPTLYYDLGAGVYRNKRTTPVDLRFCFTNSPTIILSHWDADHWAGAYVTKVGTAYPALSRDWIAPLQVVSPIHIAFAHDIVTNSGNLYIYNVPNHTLASAQMMNGPVASFSMGSGADRNGSGIVLAIEKTIPQIGAVSWILTGDCDYRHFMGVLNPRPPVGIVAPHHGADLHHRSVPPKPAATNYHRLAYSFGRDNRHGSTGVTHPTIKGITAHHNANWNHAQWMTPPPGHPIPTPGYPIPSVGSDILATCEHSPGIHRGGVVIGWEAAPALCPNATPCATKYCTLRIARS